MIVVMLLVVVVWFVVVKVLWWLKLGLLMKVCMLISLGVMILLE